MHDGNFEFEEVSPLGTKEAEIKSSASTIEKKIQNPDTSSDIDVPMKTDSAFSSEPVKKPEYPGHEEYKNDPERKNSVQYNALGHEEFKNDLDRKNSLQSTT